MKRIVIDLDGTITQENPSVPYTDKLPNPEVVERLREYRAQGFEIVVHSARNMRTYNGQVGKINIHTLPVIIGWLQKHDVPFDEIHVGKPWCGTDGFYVDDRSIRPDEFVRLTLPEIHALFDQVAPG
jgi:capsule biosynthesis phosphatase